VRLFFGGEHAMFHINFQRHLAIKKDARQGAPEQMDDGELSFVEISRSLKKTLPKKLNVEKRIWQRKKA
jgi:hypothetical protein